MMRTLCVICPSLLEEPALPRDGWRSADHPRGRSEWKKMLRSSLATLSQPPSASARSISRRKSSSTQNTPSSPAQATPQRCGPADQHRARAERQRLDDVDAAAEAAVDQHRRCAADRLDDARQRADRGDCAVELAPAVIGDDDSVGAALQRFARIVRMQKALDHQRAAPLPAQPFDVAPADRRDRVARPSADRRRRSRSARRN